MSDMKTLDCRGLACPQPVLATKAELEAATAAFLVIVDSEASCTNVRRFAESQGARVSVARQGDDHRLTIEPGHVPKAVAEPEVVCPREDAKRKDLVVLVSSEGVGRGDDRLGGILMAAFLDTLGHFEGEVSHVIFVNAGAKLAVEGSPVLDQVRQLEQVGAQVLVCGTCLNFFGIMDKLAVGRVSNMYAIIETLTQAGRIIQP